MPLIPNTNTPGLVLTSKGDGQNSSYWAGGNNGTIRITKTYAVLGPLSAGTLPGFYMAVPSGQTVNLVAVIGVLSAGTVTVKAYQNAGGIGGLTAVSVSSSTTGWVAPTANPTAVADQDYFAIGLTSPSSTGNLTFDFVFDITP